MITGLFYQKLFKKVYWFFNQFLYGKAGNSIDQLVSLESEFRFSCDDAVDKLNQTLGVKRGYIRKVLADKDALLLDFFAKGERIIIKEELEYILDNHMAVGTRLLRSSVSSPPTTCLWSYPSLEAAKRLPTSILRVSLNSTL